MTFSSDKPKRKNSPNRRRKFLLMIVLPMVALIVGFMALSPQIDSWLATDPFTPQCHFEEDRLFLTNEPIELHSINDGLIQEFPELNNVDEASWSPDGQYFVAQNYKFPDEVQGATVISAQGEEVAQASFWVARRGTEWSSNSLYFAYGAADYDQIFDVQAGQDIKLMNFLSDGYDIPTWSPNGRFKAFIGGHNLTIVDLMNESSVSTSIDGVLVGWSTDSQYAYFTGKNRLYQYDIIHDMLTELFYFPYEIYTPPYPKVRQTVSKMSPNHSKILVSLEDKFTFVIELEPFTVREIHSFQSPERILWHPDSQHLIIIDGSIGYVSSKPDKVLLYNIEDDTFRQLNLKTSDDVWVSPTGQYLSYVVGGTNFEAKTRRIYNVHTNEDTLVGEFKYNNWDRWLHHNGKDYLVILQAINEDSSHPLIAYIIDPEDNSKCKIGWTGYELEFQPE